MPRDENVVGLRLHHAGGDRADAGLGHELHADAGARVDGLQVVDELRQVLDGVDVVMGGRRDELHPGLRVTQPGDEARHLQTWQLAALAGLRALRDLDLELVGTLEIRGRDAESRGRYLLHAVVPADEGTVVQGRIFSTLT